MRALVLYATGEGQTEKIARRIAERLSERNVPVDLHDVADESVTAVALDAYDAIIVGSSIHYSHYDPNLADCLTQFRTALTEIPSAFFSVSLGILSDESSERDEVKKITDAYLDETGWTPEIRKDFAGALAYSKYGWLKRHMMHWIVSRAGTRTDVHYDYEFTDWPQVDQFVDEFLEFVESCREPEDEHRSRSIYAEPTRRYSTKHRKKTNA